MFHVEHPKLHPHADMKSLARGTFPQTQGVPHPYLPETGARLASTPEQWHKRLQTIDLAVIQLGASR